MSRSDIQSNGPTRSDSSEKILCPFSRCFHMQRVDFRLGSFACLPRVDGPVERQIR
jgi:hypothetical protein